MDQTAKTMEEVMEECDNVQVPVIDKHKAYHPNWGGSGTLGDQSNMASQRWAWQHTVRLKAQAAKKTVPNQSSSEVKEQPRRAIINGRATCGGGQVWYRHLDIPEMVHGVCMDLCLLHRRPFTPHSNTRKRASKTPIPVAVGVPAVSTDVFDLLCSICEHLRLRTNPVHVDTLCIHRDLDGPRQVAGGF